MKLIAYKDIPCPILLKEEPDIFLILFKNEQKWLYKCSLGYGEIKKDKNAIYYHFNGKLHREGGPAVEDCSGTKEWFIKDKRHRFDGPAIEYSNGTKIWYKNGKRHRLNGPACEYADGENCWYINGNSYDEEGYNKKIEEMKRDGTYSL